MSDHFWDQGQDSSGSSGEHRGPSTTGIAEVLEAYSTQGGQLLGARRWAENPLTLTHVRWVGASGGMRDAVRQPNDDLALDAAELQVWIELAMGFPSLHPSAINSEATWLALNISQQQSAGLAVRLARALARSHRALSYGLPDAYGTLGIPATGAPVPGMSGATAYGMPPLPASGPGGSFSPAPNSFPTGSLPTGSLPQGAWPASGRASIGPNPAGYFARGPIFDDGVSVIPNVEIELPGAGMSGMTPASTRDFARDAAVTFARAVKTLPQARELRGWMHGGRMILAVRLIVAPGAGAATAQECEDAMRLLAQTLALHTLPFARVGIADPGEWSQAQALTDI